MSALRARTKGLFLFCIYRHSVNAVTEIKRGGIEVRLDFSREFFIFLELLQEINIINFG